MSRVPLSHISTASACCPVSLGDRSAKDIQGVEVILGLNRGSLFLHICRNPHCPFSVCLLLADLLGVFGFNTVPTSVHSFEPPTTGRLLRVAPIDKDATSSSELQRFTGSIVPSKTAAIHSTYRPRYHCSFNRIAAICMELARMGRSHS